MQIYVNIETYVKGSVSAFGSQRFVLGVRFSATFQDLLDFRN